MTALLESEGTEFPAEVEPVTPVSPRKYPSREVAEKKRDLFAKQLAKREAELSKRGFERDERGAWVQAEADRVRAGGRAAAEPPGEGGGADRGARGEDRRHRRQAALGVRDARYRRRRGPSCRRLPHRCGRR